MFNRQASFCSEQEATATILEIDLTSSATDGESPPLCDLLNNPPPVADDTPRIAFQRTSNKSVRGSL